MTTSSDGLAMPAGGRKSMALATVKIAVFAPMPIASDNAAVAVKTGLRRSRRSPCAASCHASSIQRKDRASRCCSLTRSTLPRASRAARRAASGDRPRASYVSCNSARCASISRARSWSGRRTRSRFNRRSINRRMGNASYPSNRSFVDRCRLPCQRANPCPSCTGLSSGSMPGVLLGSQVEANRGDGSRGTAASSLSHSR